MEAMMGIPFAGTSFAEVYEQALVGPLFRPWAEQLIDEVQLTAGERVLDVACGTGCVARLAAERVGGSGKVVGIDLSAPMLAVARRVAPGIEWREGDAGSLPLQDGESFDAALSQQGFQFFADRAAAAREMHRALVPGGRVAISTWRPDDEMPFLRELRAVAERQLGPIDDRRHSLGHPGPVEAALREAGFRDVRTTTQARTIRFDDGAIFVRLNAMALAGMSASSKSMTEAERADIVDVIAGESVGVTRPYTGESGLVFEIRANVLLATR
jgi:ubiquinone/menaquinone biosynthesis C-methylase UbiE